MTEQQSPPSEKMLALQLFGAWLMVQAAALFFQQTPLLEGKLLDTDGYSHLIRVQELLAGGGWYDHVMARANAPWGDYIPWSRLFDVLILAGAALLMPFLGWEAAIFWFGALLAPLLSLASAGAFAWVVRPFLGPGRWLLPAIAFLLLPVVAAYSYPGRPDHHALSILLFVLQLKFVLLAVERAEQTRPALFAGVFCGLALWISTSNLLSVFWGFAGLALFWLLEPHGRRRQNLAFSLSFAAVTLLAVIAENPVFQDLPWALDKISLIHLILAAGPVIFWGTLSAVKAWGQVLDQGSMIARAIAGGLGAISMGLVLFALSPDFFAGPMARIDPRIVPIWIMRISELQNILPLDRVSLQQFFSHLGHLVVAGPVLIWIFLRTGGGALRRSWIFITFGLIIFLLAALLHRRFASFAEVLLLLPVVMFLDWALLRISRWRGLLPRSMATGFLMIAVILLPALLGHGVSALPGRANSPSPTTARATGKVSSCDVKALSAYLAREEFLAANGELNILTLLDRGPELLYRTPHHVVATPHHRNADGIYDNFRILSGGNDTEARDLMRNRGVNLIVLCPEHIERAFYRQHREKNRLYDRLLAEELPAWIDRHPLPPELGDSFKLFDVTP